MEASSGRFRVRPIVVDFLGTLFATFCIGVATALVLGACVMLMAGEARGAPGEARGAPGEPARAQAAREKERVGEARARAIELAATHQLVTKYTGLVAIDRTPPR
jgi:hypothetical protein